jgi:membrane fusion protein (multidrug efflux system)
MRMIVVGLAIAAAASAGLWWFQPSMLNLVGLGPSVQQRPSGQAGASAGGPGAGAAQRPPAPVETVRAATGRVADQVEALGTLSANEIVAIAPEVGGRITALHFREGQTVEQGAILIELDATIARAEREQARANLSVAQDALERNQTLVTRGAGTQVSLEQATAQLAIARANLAVSEARLEKLSIHAPFRGITGLRNVSVGAIIQPGQSIAGLTSVDPIKVDFGIPELFLSAARVGQSIDVSVDALPGRRFRGEVYAIDPVVDASGRALRLRATVANGDGALKPGLFARVNLTTAVREDAVLVPEAALVPSPTGQSSAVYLVRDGRAVLANVRTGRRSDGSVEIVEGVAAGDAVVTAGQSRLADGAPVAVAAARQPATSMSASQAAPGPLAR